jgi:hypothetical protein
MTFMATTVKAYYDGTAFVPITPLPVQTGKVFLLSVKRDDATSMDNANKLKAFRQITANLNRLNDIEPLGEEFDKIVSKRLNFNNQIDV